MSHDRTVRDATRSVRGRDDLNRWKGRGGDDLNRWKGRRGKRTGEKGDSTRNLSTARGSR
jgi:hypothetical protein